MNDIKKELIKTVGDVTKNKQRVIIDVEQRLNEPIQKRSNKLVPIFIAVIVLISVVLITPHFLKSEQAEQTVTYPKFDEKLYDFEILVQRSIYDELIDTEDVKGFVDESFAEYTMMKIYAEDHNIQLTDEDIEAAEKLYTTFQTNDETSEAAQMFQKHQENLVKNLEQFGYSASDLEEHYENFTFPKLALQNKLLEPIQEQYDKFSYSTHQFILTYTIQSYLTNKNEDVYHEIMEKYPFTEMRFNLSYSEAFILNVTDEAILYVNPNAHYFEEDEQSFVQWAPRLSDWDFEPGDVVKIGEQNSYSTTQNETEDVYSNVTHIVNMTALDQYESVRFTIDKDVLARYLSPLYWKQSTGKPSASPQLVLTDGINTYNGYVSSDKGFITWYYKDKEAKITLNKAKTLILQLVEDK